MTSWMLRHSSLSYNKHKLGWPRLSLANAENSQRFEPAISLFNQFKIAIYICIGIHKVTFWRALATGQERSENSQRFEPVTSLLSRFKSKLFQENSYVSSNNSALIKLIYTTFVLRYDLCFAYTSCMLLLCYRVSESCCSCFSVVCFVLCVA